MNPPALSVVVVVHNMVREAPRTLHSLSSAYQRDVLSGQYEVVVVENESLDPLGEAAVRCHGDNFRYEYLTSPSSSPAAALNHGVSLAAGRWVGLVIDGARLFTPGVISAALGILAEDDASCVETVGFHLGPDVQQRSIRNGYDRDVEDALLDEIAWPVDGYKLFDIATLAGSSRHGWYAPINESNGLFLSRDAFWRHDGLDERFDAPGGGMVNLDLYRRLAEDAALTRVRLLGEANFHQVHGGASTGLHPLVLRAKGHLWHRQYKRIRGHRYVSPTPPPILHGQLRSGA